MTTSYAAKAARSWQTACRQLRSLTTGRLVVLQSENLRVISVFQPRVAASLQRTLVGATMALCEKGFGREREKVMEPVPVWALNIPAISIGQTATLRQRPSHHPSCALRSISA